MFANIPAFLHHSHAYCQYAVSACVLGVGVDTRVASCSKFSVGYSEFATTGTPEVPAAHSSAGVYG